MQLAGSSERKYTFLSGTNKCQVVHNVQGASDPGQLKIKILAVCNSSHTLLFITFQSSGTSLLKLLFFWTTFIDYKRKILKENMTLSLCPNIPNTQNLQHPYNMDNLSRMHLHLFILQMFLKHYSQFTTNVF